MRELTFTGFLKSYVRSLSLGDTLSLFKLAGEASQTNPRLREPLLLYAVFTDKTDVLLRAVKGTKLSQEYAQLTNKFNKAQLVKALQDNASALPEEYRKVWRSYMSRKNRHKNDNHTKELMRERVLKLLRSKGLTNYRLYADLGLNHGNMNAWLKYGDPNKVSLDVARRAVEYLEKRV